ncbi:hypothetical protein HYT53_06140 [Candidatus Woesearchaeota archaeon]|nr:hypothetical protein [Candidatus Woesearchaeota archaeon]
MENLTEAKKIDESHSSEDDTLEDKVSKELSMRWEGTLKQIGLSLYKTIQGIHKNEQGEVEIPKIIKNIGLERFLQLSLTRPLNTMLHMALYKPSIEDYFGKRKTRNIESWLGNQYQILRNHIRNGWARRLAEAYDVEEIQKDNPLLRKNSQKKFILQLYSQAEGYLKELQWILRNVVVKNARAREGEKKANTHLNILDERYRHYPTGPRYAYDSHQSYNNGSTEGSNSTELNACSNGVIAQNSKLRQKVHRNYKKLKTNLPRVPYYHSPLYLR